MYFTFIDKEKICIFNNGSVQEYESTYITRYRENIKNEKRNKEWKKSSDIMMYEGMYQDETVIAQISSVSPTLENNKILYALSVNETSCVYGKYTDDEKKTEAHFISSNEETFKDIVMNANGEIAGTVQKDYLTSDIALFSKNGGDYKCITGGDSKDENPCFGLHGEIWFNSYGIGRDLDNEFIKYVPSEILKINTCTLELQTAVSDGKYSYVKPIVDKNGDLYCIRKPGEEKEKQNIFLQILLVPVRIVQAIIGFISFFVNIFAGKPLMDGKGKTSGGDSAAKHPDGRKLFIHNQMLNVDKELKKNKKIPDSGFIPHSWKLVRIRKNTDDFASQTYDVENAEELAHGVADFCLTEDGGEAALVYTNGKHIFGLSFANGEKKKKKLADVDFCIKIGALQTNGNEAETDLFDTI